MTQGARAGQGLAQRFPDAWLGGARRAPHAARTRRALALQPALLPSRICVKPRQAGSANVRQAGVLERRFQRRRSQLSRHRSLGSWRGGKRGCQQRGKKDWSQAKRPPAILCGSSSNSTLIIRIHGDFHLKYIQKVAFWMKSRICLRLCYSFCARPVIMKIHTILSHKPNMYKNKFRHFGS